MIGKTPSQALSQLISQAPSQALSQTASLYNRATSQVHRCQISLWPPTPLNLTLSKSVLTNINFELSTKTNPNINPSATLWVVKFEDEVGIEAEGFTTSYDRAMKFQEEIDCQIQNYGWVDDKNKTKRKEIIEKCYANPGFYGLYNEDNEVSGHREYLFLPCY
jgi:hypothetical protein